MRPVTLSLHRVGDPPAGAQEPEPGGRGWRGSSAGQRGDGRAQQTQTCPTRDAGPRELPCGLAGGGSKGWGKPVAGKPLGPATWVRAPHAPLTTATGRGATSLALGWPSSWAGVVAETVSRNWAPDSNGGQTLGLRMWVWPLRVRNKVMHLCGERQGRGNGSCGHGRDGMATGHEAGRQRSPPHPARVARRGTCRAGRKPSG